MDLRRVVALNPPPVDPCSEVGGARDESGIYRDGNFMYNERIYTLIIIHTA